MFDIGVTKVFDCIEQAGFEIRLVGGAVRDHVMGKNPSDYDFCTTALPEQVASIIKSSGYKCFDTGIAHGTVTAVIDHVGYEITTLRSDVDTDGRHAKVEFVNDFEIDAARRDFTCNALMMDRHGKIYDYFGGLSDIDQKVLKFIGNAQDRINEDYLRILRYFRFAAKLGFSLQLELKEIISSPKSLTGLKSVSVERYWLEMNKLLSIAESDTILQIMNKWFVLQTIGLTLTSRNYTGNDSIAKLSTLIEDYDQFVSKWKLSTQEKTKLKYIFDNTLATFSLDAYEDKFQSGVDIDWLCIIAEINQQNDLLDRIKTFSKVKFPLTGKDLLEAGFTQGVELGKALASAKEAWIQSRYKANKTQLLELINSR